MSGSSRLGVPSGRSCLGVHVREVMSGRSCLEGASGGCSLGVLLWQVTFSICKTNVGSKCLAMWKYFKRLATMFYGQGRRYRQRVQFKCYDKCSIEMISTNMTRGYFICCATLPIQNAHHSLWPGTCPALHVLNGSTNDKRIVD